ncbi:MAG TPA: HAD-IIIA family hydrolase [Streptosporangiaceae bacterium]|nr:HAD-IIIA family hydrolase [Streptosporangiaceae bacterium]
MISYSVVIPTLGRPALAACLEALAGACGPPPEQVVIVDDRPGAAMGDPFLAMNDCAWDRLAPWPVRVVTTGGVGPAAARNAGWQQTGTPWVAFLDDDVRVGPDWRERLEADLSGLPDWVAGVQGRIEVPAPAGRRPTDWERVTMGLAGARWATADMAYRRVALAESGGFDERFPRAFREDADLALRLLADGWELRRGRRRTVHPVRPASPWISVRSQAGNADDALMGVLHGRGWPRRAGATVGRRPRHAVITVAALAAAGFAAARRPRLAAAAAALALAGTAEFAAARIAPGPRTAGEVAVMTATSLVIPELACWHWLRGRLAAGRLAAGRARSWPAARAVLFDRDGTLIADVPYNGDPALVRPLPGAAAAVAAARRHGLRVAMVTNQSGIARGLISAADAAAVNARVAELLGPFDVVKVCPHGDGDGCACRKPAPGLVAEAAADLGVAPRHCVMIGDIGADVAAARAAGTRGVLVPQPATRAAELAGVRVAGDLGAAVGMATGDLPMAPVWPPGRAGRTR